MKRVLIQVGDITHQRWKDLAAERSVSMSELARKLIEAELDWKPDSVNLPAAKVGTPVLAGCSHPTHGRKGWKCKGCGEVS